MGVAGYFGSVAGLRLKAEDLAKGGTEVAKGLPVEEAQSPSAVRARRLGERYESVGDYDPVLRAHCRLDQEG
jgi:hypothetical protein